MTFAPLIPLGVLVAAGVALLWAAWRSTSYRHALLGGAFLGPALGFHVPVLALLALMLADGDFDVKLFVPFGMVLGIASAILATPAALVATLLSRLLSMLLFPVSSGRGPHESLAALSQRIGGDMTLKKALTIILGLTVLGGGLGCLGGFLLGTYNPGYYRSVTPGGQRPDFDPVAVGIGLGLGQWAAAGAALGVLLVIVLTWYDLRCRQIAADAAREPLREMSPGPRDDRITE